MAKKNNIDTAGVSEVGATEVAAAEVIKVRLKVGESYYRGGFKFTKDWQTLNRLNFDLAAWQRILGDALLQIGEPDGAVP